jgi:hypothetical protein
MSYKKVEEGLVEVGDILVIETALGKSKFPITRVTKTLSLSKRESDGHEHRFIRKIKWDMAYPRMEWNTNEYTVYRETDG